ncbi:RNA-directed DNA polymerase, eukaryota [Tanacetum coccineum]
MEDSANITKALANDFNTFIATLNSNGMGDASIKELRNDEKVEGAAVAIPLSAVEEFETKEGMDKKVEIKAALVWVKLHHVPIVAYSETGLSLITTQIGRPIMLDSYTSQMCLRSWGRNEYARALIEVSSETDLMDSIVIDIPYSDGKGHTLATIDIEYEWRPPHCSTCKLFDHTNDACPKLPKVAEPVQVNTDGFIEVQKKKNKPKQPIKQHTKSRQVDGIRFQKPKLNLYYRRVEHGETSNTQQKGDTSNASKKDHMNKPSSKPQGTGMELKNSFTSLDIDEDDLWDQGVSQNALNVINESDSEEVDEELVLEGAHQNATTENSFKRVSTPSEQVPHD